jgi:hypothetical protein
MSALGTARAELATLLEAEGVQVRESPSKGQMSPPAAIITPGPEWVIANAQLGTKLHGRVQLSVTFITGRIAAGASLAALEDLIEQALPALIPRKWILSTVSEPFALTIAGTEYLAANATITRPLILS